MILKDYKRAERLNEVYKHLFANFGIKSKKEMADYMKIQRTGLSAALNGAAANLTDNLFKKICLAWPGVFNLDYLLTGEGELLINGEQKQKEMPPSEQAANILEIYANRIRLLDDMRTNLSEELAEIRMIKEELTQARDDFRQATARLSDTLHLLNIATPLIAADDREAPENRENNA